MRHALASTLLFLALLCTCGAASALTDGERARLIESVRRGYFEAARELGAPASVPDLIDLLQKRFPADVAAFLDAAAAVLTKAPPPTETEIATASRQLFARSLSTILTRDGAKVRAAPLDSLQLLIGLRRDVFAYLGETDPAACVPIYFGAATAGVAAKDARGKLLFLSYSYRLYAAIADGRDNPAGAAAESSSQDLAPVVAAMHAAGIPYSDAELLGNRDRLAADPPKACRLLIALFDGMLAQTGESARRVLAGAAAESFSTDAAVFDQPAK